MDFVEEVSEELQQDKYLRLWSQYKIPAFAFIGMFILGIGGYAYWKHTQETNGRRAFDEFFLASRAAEDGDPYALQVISAEGPAPFQDLARIVLGKPTEHTLPKALESYGAFEVLRKKAAEGSLTLSDVDTFEGTLGTNAFLPLAQELKGILLLKSNPAEAAAVFEALKTAPKVPLALRTRAHRMVLLLRSQGFEAKQDPQA